MALGKIDGISTPIRRVLSSAPNGAKSLASLSRSSPPESPRVHLHSHSKREPSLLVLERMNVQDDRSPHLGPHQPPLQGLQVASQGLRLAPGDYFDDSRNVYSKDYNRMCHDDVEDASDDYILQYETSRARRPKLGYIARTPQYSLDIDLAPPRMRASHQIEQSFPTRLKESETIARTSTQLHQSILEQHQSKSSSHRIMDYSSEWFVDRYSLESSEHTTKEKSKGSATITSNNLALNNTFEAEAFQHTKPQSGTFARTNLGGYRTRCRSSSDDSARRSNSDDIMTSSSGRSSQSSVPDSTIQARISRAIPPIPEAHFLLTPPHESGSSMKWIGAQTADLDATMSDVETLSISNDSSSIELIVNSADRSVGQCQQAELWQMLGTAENWVDGNNAREKGQASSSHVHNHASSMNRSYPTGTTGIETMRQGPRHPQWMDGTVRVSPLRGRLRDMESDFNYLLSAEDQKLAEEELEGLRQVRIFEDNEARRQGNGSGDTYGMESDTESIGFVSESDDAQADGEPQQVLVEGTKRKVSVDGAESLAKRKKGVA